MSTQRLVLLLVAAAVLVCSATSIDGANAASSSNTDPVASPFDGDVWKAEQIHIALAGMDEEGNSNGMSIMWNTKLMTETSVCNWGLTSTKLDKTTIGSSAVYYITHNHEVTLSDLKADTVYYYSCGDANRGFSEVRSFRTAPRSEDLRENWSFAFFADLGVVNGAPTTDYVGSMTSATTDGEQDGIRLVWHGGDVGYADDSFLHWGCYARFCYESTFDEYMVKASEQWASQVPYMTTPGNHEADCHSPACMVSERRRSLLSNFTAYNTRFHMPSKESNGTLNMHYSFNYGNVHFISMDTETGFPNAALESRYVLPCGGFADQVAWLEEDLRVANLPENRKKQPWVFVAGHRPMYDQAEVNAAFQAAMEDLFYRYGVDVYFGGHKHYYSRNYPVYKGEVDQNYYNNPAATTYITAGGSGNDEMTDIQRRLAQEAEDAAANNSEPGVSKPIDLAPPDHSMRRLPGYKEGAEGPWTAVNDKVHVAATKVTIIDDSTMRIDYVHTKTGFLADTVTLKRDHSKFPQELPAKVTSNVRGKK